LDILVLKVGKIYLDGKSIKLETKNENVVMD